MAGHNPSERRLFTEIKEKNRLAGEFRRISGRMRRWQQRLTQKRGKRWQAQYASSIHRAQEWLEAARGELLSQAQDLKQRIETEQKVSKTEIREFEKQYKKEVAELMAAQEQLAAADEAFTKAQQKAGTEGGDAAKSSAVLSELRRRRRSAAREATRETQDVKRAKREIASEQQDKGVLSHELRRTTAEIESLSI